jgi:NADH-quinone oxidoreductase subunit M
LLAAFNPADALVDAGYLTLYRVLVVFGAFGTVLTAGYFLWMLQRVNMGNAPVRWKDEGLADVTPIEYGTWAPLLVLIIVLGFLPFLIFGITTNDVNAILAVFTGGA